MFRLFINDEFKDQICVDLREFVKECREYDEFDNWYDSATKFIYKYKHMEDFSVESPETHLFFIFNDSYEVLEDVEEWLDNKFDDLECEIEEYIEELESECEDKDEEYDEEY